jgi:hypothetical protein
MLVVRASSCSVRWNLFYGPEIDKKEKQFDNSTDIVLSRQMLAIVRVQGVETTIQ